MVLLEMELWKKKIFLYYIMSGSFRSYAFTIRPLMGVKQKLEDGVVKWLSKHKGFLCSEMEDEARHLHGVIYLDTPKTKGDLNKSLESICARS